MVIRHASDVTNPSDLSFADQCDNGGNVGLLQDLGVRNFILPVSLKTFEVEVV